jgi:hypothetical protein
MGLVVEFFPAAALQVADDPLEAFLIRLVWTHQ